MASVEFITKRIQGKEKEIEKLTKKMERIRKAEATNWTVNPYYYSEYDIRVTTREIEDAQKALEGYKAQLVTATEKDNSRNVEVILRFLEMWKTRVREYYIAGLTKYFAEKKAVREAYGTPEYEELRKAFYTKCKGEFKEQTGKNPYTGRTETYKVKVKDGEYECLRPYSSFSNVDEAVDKLDKDLEQEAKRKYDFIIERTNAIVGTITDASNLTIGAKDDLNGYIIGERGVAKVQTIGAGGYNIQCFHFRTLINTMR